MSVSVCVGGRGAIELVFHLIYGWLSDLSPLQSLGHQSNYMLLIILLLPILPRGLPLTCYRTVLNIRSGTAVPGFQYLFSVLCERYVFLLASCIIMYGTIFEWNKWCIRVHRTFHGCLLLHLVRKVPHTGSEYNLSLLVHLVECSWKACIWLWSIH